MGRWLMNSGRTIFTQIMDYLSTYEFRQCVERYSGNYKIKSFSCWDHFLSSDTRQESQIILCRRFIWHRVGTNDIYTGCHNHRSLLISLSVGGIPQAQGSGETVYTTSVVRPTLLFIYYFSSKYFPRVQSIRTRGDFGYEYQYSS